MQQLCSGVITTKVTHWLTEKHAVPSQVSWAELGVSNALSGGPEHEAGGVMQAFYFHL